MKIKHMLAVTALILIFTVTACTQYVFEFPTDKEITTVEDLVKFMQKHEKDSAKVNLTIDPDNSYLPITINGNKTITGKITIKEDSPFPFPFSSVTTYATKAGATNLFEIADNASLSVTNFEASVTSNAADSINAIIYVDEGEFNADSFTSSKSVTGLSIGPKATASQISITDSNIGKIAIDETNKNTGIYDKILSGNTSDAEISTGFDATNAKEFGYALNEFKRVRLMADFSIENDDIEVDNDNDNSDDKDNPNRDFLDFKGTYIIDLNGHKLTSYEPWDLEEGTEIRISNGSLTMINSKVIGLTNPSIALYENSKLYLDTVNYYSDVTGLFFKNYESEMILDIKDSKIIADGYYGIGTNASAPESVDLTLRIYRTTITTENCSAKDPCSTAILFNVEGDVTIENSTIIGNRQAMVARGGNYDLRNSTFKATGNDYEDDDFISTWGQGNEVPLAAIVFGNNNSGSSYAYPTTAELYNVTIEAPLTNKRELPYHGIYIRQNNDQEPVTVEGSIRRGNDCEVNDHLYNKETTNDAHVIITQLN